jgi:feruloyl esterase
MKAGFKPDGQTAVLMVKAFKKGDPLILSGTPSTTTPTALNDVCMVKLNIGPGNAGPASAFSTSPGIGIEIWLPTPDNWNGRMHVLGGGGWAGGVQGSTTQIARSSTPIDAASVATIEGAVSATTDTGHADTTAGGSFAMNPDGSINTILWNDFAVRSLHQMAVETKALIRAYYGRMPTHSYWEGGSTGGRQGMKEAQLNPGDFDGIVANYPGINWSRFITGDLYPQIVFQRDLAGVPLSTAQQDMVSNAAISACDQVGGQHLGYIPDPSACHYDPTTDARVLCAANGGTNETAACVTPLQATAVNKIWYGMTADGSVPPPVTDNGWSTTLAGAQRWYGMPRGTSLYGGLYFQIGVDGQASPNGPFTVASDMVALELQNPTIASTNFKNATGNGVDGWKALSYAQLSDAYDRGVALQSSFANIDTDLPDLAAFNARGGKLLTWHGLADELVPPQGTINYYTRVVAQMGGLSTVQNFYRLYLVPGDGHGTPNGTANPLANPPVVAPGQIYTLLTDWVENGNAPGRVELSTLPGAPAQRTRPICPYPQKATYTSGDPNITSSYICS